ncbi:unnamed protein product [Anisakis simplex]|uniref:2-(3-amino-3-carboxypropyl)histidine synthase subunit 2 n=1 Tax=Anisakis simplex TaxID=6269 RepID=A0A0M3K7K1_ANISI|nr:unnamed protein product [Anisakis simplex]
MLLSRLSSEGFKRVALQFPDHLLRYACRLAEKFELLTGAKTFILADTSYRSCCCDYVAAEHARADCLIHYGESCLSQAPSSGIPVRYVFGHLPIDTTALGEHLSKYTAKNDEQFSSNCVLVYDTLFTRSSGRVKVLMLYGMTHINQFVAFAIISGDILSVLSTHLPNKRIHHCEIIDPTKSPSPASEDDQMTKITLGRRVPVDLSELDEFTLIFIGQEDSAILPLWLMTYPNCTKMFSYSPITLESSFSSCSTNRSLRKRLFLIEKIRDARILGVVVGTVAVNAYRSAIERLRQLCKNVSKKLYVLSVGKVNVAKLSNFATDIDAFILLSCPFGVMLETSEYYRPVVSLFEAEIALNSDKQWMATGGWTAEFKNFISDSIGAESDPSADVSLITGRIRTIGGTQQTNSTATDQKNHADSSLTVYTAGWFLCTFVFVAIPFVLNRNRCRFDCDYFANRTWKGLNESCTRDEDEQNSVEVVEGRAGIASSYTNEPKKQ